MPVPEPGENEVLIRARAIGLNPVDVTCKVEPVLILLEEYSPSHLEPYLI